MREEGGGTEASDAGGARGGVRDRASGYTNNIRYGSQVILSYFRTKVLYCIYFVPGYDCTFVLPEVHNYVVHIHSKVCTQLHMYPTVRESTCTRRLLSVQKVSSGVHVQLLYV